MALSISHLRALEKAAIARRRAELADLLLRLRRQGACIRIRKTRCRHTRTGWDYSEQWTVTIGLPHTAASVERPDKLDALSNAIQAVS